MNFDPIIPNHIAIGMGLLAASMWGSWFITLKYLGDYPLEAFYITLFSSSMVVVFSVGFLFDGRYLIGNIIDVLRIDPSRVIVTFVCGILYVLGMQFSLRVLRILGLAVSQPIQASIGIIGGTAISAVIGGIPESMTVARVSFAVVFLLTAVLLSIRAGILRNRAQKIGNINIGLSTDPKQIKKAYIMLVLAAVLTPAYTTALSYGLRSITQTRGLAVLPFMVVLCTGAFVGAFVVCGTIITKRKQWHVFVSFPFKIHLLGTIAGFAHYGGNIIHTFATRNLSAVVSWPLGFTAGLWTQLWGIVYGEFKGSPKKVYYIFGAGVACYIIGAMIISNVI